MADWELQQFMATGMMPDIHAIGGGAIGTSLVFGDAVGFNRKRSLEAIEDDWSTVPTQGQEAREIKRIKSER